MIKTGRSKRIDIIIEMILKKIDELDMNIEFDNQYANHYALIINGERYEFNTYGDLYNAVKLMTITKKESR
jgi:hypothetical protein